MITTMKEALKAIETGKIITVARKELPPLAEAVKRNNKAASDYVDGDSLLYEIQNEGQHQAMLLMKRDGQSHYDVLWGNRRLFAFDKADKEDLDFGTDTEFAGKRMADHIRAIVIPQCSPEIEQKLRYDQAQQMPASASTLAIETKRMIDLGASDQEIYVKNARVLDQVFGRRTDIKSVLEDKGKDLVEKRKGAFRAFIAAAKLGEPVFSQWLKYVEKKQAWPAPSEVWKVYAAFNEDRANADKIGKPDSVRQNKLGPLSKAAWEQVATEGKKATEEGKAPRKVGFATRETVKTQSSASQSKTRRLESWLLLNSQFANPHLGTLDFALKAVEDADTGAKAIEAVKNLKKVHDDIDAVILAAAPKAEQDSEAEPKK